MLWLASLLFFAVLYWAIARFFLQGEDLSRYDVPAPDPVNDGPSQANDQVLQMVGEFTRAAADKRGRERLAYMREAMDALGDRADLDGVTITPVTAAGRPGEWITAKDQDAGRLLYLHGGAFTMGSPRSHRAITAELARRTGLAILAVEYRLMPEHPRAAGLEDSRAAYRWLVDNGPNGRSPARCVFVAGDSAGGNLTLSLVAWLRDHGPRAAPPLPQATGAIALSPLTDATFASPSLSSNIELDPMLGAMARMILRVPRPLLLWGSWLQNRFRPTDPAVSPLRGSLADLPPILVQASEAEILIDDARRYANKARAAGSPVELQTWHGMVHVWQAFGPDLPESTQAFERIGTFVRRVLESRDQADAA